MNILVYNPAAITGGALSVLETFIQDVSNDENNTYWIVVSKVLISYWRPNNNVNFIYIERDYLSRLNWIYFNMSRFVHNNNIDAIVFLENICNIFYKKKPQYVYVHQSLQFAPTKLLSLNLAVKIKLINNFLMKYSCKNAKLVVVQTNWMREKVAENYVIDINKVHVISPSIPKYSLDNKDCELISYIQEKKEKGYYLGIYVTNSSKYKKIETIIEFIACNNNDNDKKIFLILTISCEESEYAQKIKKLAKELGVDNEILFTGNLSRDTLHSIYDICDALFYSSAIETVGLPLIESMTHSLRIFAPELPYVNEVCGEYAFKYTFGDSGSLYMEYLKYGNHKVPILTKHYIGESFMKFIELITNDR